MNTTTSSEWLQKALRNLTREGFIVSEDVRHDSMVSALARRTRFEPTKFGFSETFFVFRQFESISAGALRKFSSEAFDLATQSKSIPLPRGLFESVWCFAVAITDHTDDATMDTVRNDAPTKHWAAAEIPVVFDQTEERLYYFEKTPLWGGAYYSGFRTQIERYLAT